MDERLEKATKELAGVVADKSKQAFGKAKNIAENIDTEEINKQVKKIGKETKKELEKHSKKAKNASLGIATFWKTLSKRNQIIVAVIGIIIVCGLFSGGRNVISNGEKVTGKESGEKLLREMFPSEEYTIQYQNEKDLLTPYFNVDVGEFCSDGYGGESVHVYFYNVKAKKENGGFHDGTYWVAEDGRVVGFGTLVSELLPTEFKRIR